MLPCLLIFKGQAEEPKEIAVITPAEAASQEGKEARVKGLVEGQKASAGGNTYLNFGGKFPNHVFSCILRAKNFAGGVPDYLGKTVEVSGTIAMYQGKPSMDIASLDQIKVVEETPAAPAGEAKSEGKPTP